MSQYTIMIFGLLMLRSEGNHYSSRGSCGDRSCSGCRCGTLAGYAGFPARRLQVTLSDLPISPTRLTWQTSPLQSKSCVGQGKVQERVRSSGPVRVSYIASMTSLYRSPLRFTLASSNHARNQHRHHQLRFKIITYQESPLEVTS